MVYYTEFKVRGGKGTAGVLTDLHYQHTSSSVKLMTLVGATMSNKRRRKAGKGQKRRMRIGARRRARERRKMRCRSQDECRRCQRTTSCRRS